MGLDIQSFSHHYNSGQKVKVAIENLSLQVEPIIFRLLGPNGASKSNLMRLLKTKLK